MFNQKGIAPVVAVTMLLGLTVLAVSGFKVWYNYYTSSEYAIIEGKKAIGSEVLLNAVLDNTLYLKSGSDTTLNSFKIVDSNNNVKCKFEGNVNISSESLVGYWTFDETVSYNSTHDYTPDLSGLGNHGILHDLNHTNQDGNTPPRLVESKLGNALKFDGVDDYVRIQNGEDLDLIQNFTILSLVKSQRFENDSIYQPIFSKWNCTISCGLSSYWFGITRNEVEPGGKSNYFGFRFINESGSYIIVNESIVEEKISDNSYKLLTGILNTTNFYSYIDNHLDSNKYVSNQKIQSSNELILIGTSSHNLDDPSDIAVLKGQIDEIRIYNRTLGKDEIKRLYWHSFRNLNKGINEIDISSCNLQKGNEYKLVLVSNDFVGEDSFVYQ